MRRKPITNDDLAAAAEAYGYRAMLTAMEEYDNPAAELAEDVKIVLRHWHRANLAPELRALANMAACNGVARAVEEVELTRWTLA